MTSRIVQLLPKLGSWYFQGPPGLAVKLQPPSPSYKLMEKGELKINTV